MPRRSPSRAHASFAAVLVTETRPLERASQMKDAGHGTNFTETERICIIAARMRRGLERHAGARAGSVAAGHDRAARDQRHQYTAPARAGSGPHAIAGEDAVASANDRTRRG